MEIYYGELSYKPYVDWLTDFFAVQVATLYCKYDVKADKFIIAKKSLLVIRVPFDYIDPFSGLCFI